MKNTPNNPSKDIVQFLTSRYSELTEGEKQVVDYLLRHAEQSLGMSVQMLAAGAGVSVATVVRFAQHMGFDGYKAFRLYLAQCRTENDDFVLDLPNTESSVEGQVSRVLQASTEALNQTREFMDYPTLKKLADQIREADQLLFFGTGTSNIVCLDAMLKYQRSGKKAFSACDIYSAALVMANFEPKDLLVVISHSGQNDDVLRVLRAAVSSGIRSAAVTTFAGSPIAKEAGTVLYTQTRESPLHNVSITSRISQFGVMDALFMAYLTMNYEACAAHNEHLAEYLRLFELI